MKYSYVPISSLLALLLMGMGGGLPRGNIGATTENCILLPDEEYCGLDVEWSVERIPFRKSLLVEWNNQVFYCGNKKEGRQRASGRFLGPNSFFKLHIVGSCTNPTFNSSTQVDFFQAGEASSVKKGLECLIDNDGNRLTPGRGHLTSVEPGYLSVAVKALHKGLNFWRSGISKMKEAGVHSMGVEFRWDFVEKEGPLGDEELEMPDQEIYDEIFHVNDAPILPNLLGTPAWAKENIEGVTTCPQNNNGFCKPENGEPGCVCPEAIMPRIAPWKDFVRKAVRKYGTNSYGNGMMREWEIWTEPPTPKYFYGRSPETRASDYVEVLNAAYSVIHETPGTSDVVWAPSTAFVHYDYLFQSGELNRNHEKWQFLMHVMDHGNFDAFTFHPFMDNTYEIIKLTKEVRKELDLRPRTQGKPLVISDYNGTSSYARCDNPAWRENRVQYLNDTLSCLAHAGAAKVVFFGANEFYSFMCENDETGDPGYIKPTGLVSWEVENEEGRPDTDWTLPSRERGKKAAKELDWYSTFKKISTHVNSP